MKEGNLVRADFELKRKDGSLVDSSAHSGCLEYVEELGMVPPGIEKALSGLAENTEFDVILKAEDMYGLRDEENLVEVPAEGFHGGAGELEEGVLIEADTPEGLKVMTVKSVHSGKVILDANHPLAGEDLIFTGRIKKAAPATKKEIEALTKSCCCGHEHHDHDHQHGHGECCGGHGHHDHEEHCRGSHGQGRGHHHDHGEHCCGGHGEGHGHNHGHGGCCGQHHHG